MVLIALIVEQFHPFGRPERFNNFLDIALVAPLAEVGNTFDDFIHGWHGVRAPSLYGSQNNVSLPTD